MNRPKPINKRVISNAVAVAKQSFYRCYDATLLENAMLSGVKAGNFNKRNNFIYVDVH